MDFTSIIILGLTTGLGVLGFLVKSLYYNMRENMSEQRNELKKLENDLQQVKVDYAHKSDLIAIKNEIMARFDKFEDRLEALRK
jgi:hypothetical protein